eukprot:scaffold1243_cov173-Ochromonas_danica.AAC.20
MSSSISDSLQTGLGALTSFSTILSEVLASIDGKIGSFSYTLEGSLEQIKKVSLDLLAQEERLKYLESIANDQKSVVQQALSSFQHDVEEKLSDATNSIHKEVVSQRTLSKMDINSLRGKLSHSMSEALAMIQDGAVPSTPAEAVQYLTERVKKMEEAITLQNEAIQSDEVVQKVYDSLFEQIQTVTHDYRSENAALKQQLREQKTIQREHERLIAELHQALVNEHRMEQLKKKITERKAFVANGHDPKDIRLPKAAAEPMRRVTNVSAAGPSIGDSSSTDNKDPGVAPLEIPQEGGILATELSERLKMVSSSPSSGSSSPKRLRPLKGSPKKRKSRNFAVPRAIDENDHDHDDNANEGGHVENRDSGTSNENSGKPAESYGSGDELSVKEDDSMGSKKDRTSTGGDASKNDGDDEDDGYEEYNESPGPFLHGDSIFSENNSVTDYYYGSDYTRKLVGSLEQRHEETQQHLLTLQDDMSKRVTELEGSVNIFKRLALVIDDLKLGFETLRNKVETVTGQESIDEKVAQSLFAKIKHCKDSWARVHAEMVFGLDNIPESEKELLRKPAPDDSNSPWPLSAAQLEAQRRDYEQKLFFRKSIELVTTLDNVIEEFVPRENLEITLKGLYPKLLDIYNQAEVLLDMDAKARESTALDYCFDDIICSDLSTSLKSYVQEAIHSSVPVLDECTHEVELYKMIVQAHKLLSSKADSSAVMKADQEIRSLLHIKVDHAEFVAVTSKMASSAELQRLQAQLSDRLSTAGGVGTHGPSQFGGAGLFGGESDPITLRDQPEFMELKDRFVALSNKVIDLQTIQVELIRKDEVLEAMKAVVGEVKNLRSNCVLLPVFKQGLKLKADASELEKVVKQITLALGNINLSDFATSSAAVHAKCLICDKPISAQRARSPGDVPMPVPTGTAIAMSRSLPALYDKQNDRPQTTSKKGGGIMSKISKPNERAKIASEINILRSSINAPPDLLTDSIDSPRSSVPVMTPTSIANSSFRNRIRSSAGGGMGPNFTSDTR